LRSGLCKDDKRAKKSKGDEDATHEIPQI
jgi:hypothetical protein